MHFEIASLYEIIVRSVQGFHVQQAYEPCYPMLPATIREGKVWTI